MKKAKVRYAVVGLGHIAQAAVLPAFKNARENSELTALVSGEPSKLKALCKKYNVRHGYDYTEFQKMLSSGNVDAVYLATPNVYHEPYAMLAAEAGVHILCEKPLATDVNECAAMIEVADENRVKLMTAYRLHFERANLESMKIAQSGQLGDLKIFNSLFSFNVTDHENIRLRRDLGGGPLFDKGIYCINAARHLFASEPIEGWALAASSDDERFAEVDETVSVHLRFPEDRIASFTVSFGAQQHSHYELIGNRGSLRLDGAYDYGSPMVLTVNRDQKIKKKTFPKRDQFGPELVYFSNCILKDKEPEPNGEEGMIDVQIIQSLHESLDLQRPVHITSERKHVRPSLSQGITRFRVKPPKIIEKNSTL